MTCHTLWCSNQCNDNFRKQLWNAVLCDAARGGGDALANKTSRTTEGEIRGRTVRWEWEGDGGKWMQFSKEHSLAMTDALNKKKNQVSFYNTHNNNWSKRWNCMLCDSLMLQQIEISDCTKHFSKQGNIYKVVKMVYGNQSDNHCNLSNTEMDSCLHYS